MISSFTGEYPFILDTDASGVGLGAVLSQRYPNGDRVLGYFSYSLSAKERGWSITEREAYAIVKAVRHFRHIIAGMPFTVVTDHHALRYLLEMKDPYGKINRWVTELQQYQLSIQHRSGVNHSNADAMSRPPVVQPSPDADHHPCDEPDGTVSLRDLLSHVAPRPPSSPGISDVSINASTTILPSSPDPVLLSQQLPPINRIQELQRQDPVLVGYITYIQDGSLKNVAPDIRPLLMDLDNYSLTDGTLYHHWRPPSAGPVPPKDRIQLAVPQELRKLVLPAHHENILAGHRGFAGTFNRLRRNYFWPGMRADVHSWVNSCLPCARRKRDRRGATTGLKGIAGSDRPFDTIAMDFLGPLPVTPNGNKYILVVNDYATRYVCAFPLKTADAPAVSQVLIERVFLEYGPPATILSDRGPHFHNALIEAITQLFMARHVFSSGYRPQTAGITERFNQTLLDLLAMYVDKNQRNWDQLVPYVVFAYRTLYNPTVKNVPFYLLHGYEPVLPHELPLLPPHANQSAADREWNMVAQRLNSLVW